MLCRGKRGKQKKQKKQKIAKIMPQDGIEHRQPQPLGCSVVLCQSLPGEVCFGYYWDYIVSLAELADDSTLRQKSAIELIL
jgi:hypothetical protein